MKRYITLVALSIAFVLTTSFSLLKPANELVSPIPTIEKTNDIEWLTFEQAVELNKIEKKKILVNIYTNNCVWCVQMDRTTLKEPLVADYINDTFYPVKLNAEDTRPVEINGKKYNYVRKNKGGYHELAALLTNGRLSSPTYVFIDEDLKVIQPIAGYKSVEEFEVIMTYFGGNFHKKIPWVSYKKKFFDETEGPKPTYIKN